MHENNWVSIGEAAALVLNRMVVQQEAEYTTWKPKASPRRKVEAPKAALRNLGKRFPK